MTRSGRQRTGRLIGALAATLGIGLLVPGVAGAAYTGSDGSVAFVAVSSRSVAVDQVDPAAADGTPRGDRAATTPLTAGPGDAGPAYSPDGTLLAFASDRSGSTWSIYTIGPTRGGGASVSMVSQATGSATHDDFAPSFTDDGRAVVFDRDNARIETTVLASGPASTCTLFVPPSGLAPASPRDGSGSRIVVDPVDPSVLAFAGGDGHIHLLSGVVPPTAARPCPVQSHLTDTDLSAEATGATVTPYADAHPDWSPDGSRIVFDSSRPVVPRGTRADDGARPGVRTLWFLDGPTSQSPTVVPVWPGSTASTAASQPVFSPDGTRIAFTRSAGGGVGGQGEGDPGAGGRRAGTVSADAPAVGGGDGGGEAGRGQVFEVGIGQPRSRAVDLSLGSGPGGASQPNWQPALPAPTTPEAPSAALLPPIGLAVGGGVLLVRNRRLPRRGRRQRFAR